MKTTTVTRARRWVLAIGAVCALGCGGGNGTDGPPDAATDAPVGGDSGDIDASPSDAAPPDDAGSTDAAPPDDAGDAGNTSDAGGATDAGDAGDAGNTSDAGGGSDAGPVAVCGNRILEPTEECEDGNTANGDGCDDTCAREPSSTCGDGDVDLAAGEECDDGGRVTGDGCDGECFLEPAPSCGDGTLDLADDEQCDDGNTDAGDGCGPACQFEPVGQFCGDRVVDANEVCDDGPPPVDTCNATCNFHNRTRRFIGSPGTAGFLDGADSAGALLGGFGGLAADDRYLWFGDGTNRRLRRIDLTAATVAIQTVAGDGTNASVDDPDGSMASFTTLEAITSDGATVWVGGGRQIRAVDVAPPHGVTTVVVGGAPRRAAATASGRPTAAAGPSRRPTTCAG